VKRLFVLAASAAALVAVAATAGMTATSGMRDEHPAANHVLLLSIDGLHQSDLSWYVRRNPSSALAKLVHKGVEFTDARTPFPSDSFPGMVGQVTGGNPKSTGIYYDDSWNHSMFPAGTTNCSGPAPGAEVTYFEQADKNPLALDAGQGLPGLPDGILQVTGDATSLIDRGQLPEPYTSSGLRAAHAGAAAAGYFGVPAGDPRAPDVLGISQVGAVYTGKQAKIAEHGGDNPQDRAVPLVVSGGPVEDSGDVVDTPVETTQIAPTILRLLGLDPNQLQAVRIEHTETLSLGG